MNSIKNSFSIQDLEILSGIKAHTIRIWEKRYNILNPNRLNRNVRIYSLTDLQKLLNISLLYRHNYKISKIAKFTAEDLLNVVKTVTTNEFTSDLQLNSLIVSMYTLDENLFQDIYNQQIEALSFENIFTKVYIPLLNYIGLLWQTNAIKPAHEHFISNLIFQKIALNTALIKDKSAAKKRVHVLFLPEGEIHEIGLLFLNYYLKEKGEKTIYLGRSIPNNNLVYLGSQFEEINWISYSLINKSYEDKQLFINQMEALLLDTNNTCNIIGKIWGEFSLKNENNQMIFFEGFNNLIESKVI